MGLQGLSVVICFQICTFELLGTALVITEIAEMVL